MRTPIQRALRTALVGLGILATVSGPGRAIEFRAGQEVVVAAGEVIGDDLYATGETVTIDGTIEGDLVAAGREIRVNGEVTGDLIAAGQAVLVNGRVGDDVRMAGFVLRLGSSASVEDDVVSAGFSFDSEVGSFNRGSLLFSGFQALLAGDIGEGLLGTMSALEIRGGIGGDSEVSVEGDPTLPSFVQYLPSPLQLPTVPGGLTISEEARIDGLFAYTSSSKARGTSTGSGEVIHHQPIARPEAAAIRKSPWPGRFFKLAGLVILGLFLAWRVPLWLDGRSSEIEKRPLPLAGLGLLGVAALPIASVILVVLLCLLAAFFGLLKLGNLAALTMVLGLVALCLLIVAAWLTGSYLAPLLVGLCTGRWVMRRFAAERARGIVLPLIAGLVLLAVLRYIPIVGFLVALIVLLLGLGVVLMWLWKCCAQPGQAAARSQPV